MLVEVHELPHAWLLERPQHNYATSGQTLTASPRPSPYRWAPIPPPQWYVLSPPLTPYGVPPPYPGPAFRPLDPELCLEQILCFKHRRRVARDNTVRFQLHTLQLLPKTERPSYAGAAEEVLESLDGQLSVRHEGRIVPAQEAPPSPVFLRNGHGPSDAAPVPSSGTHGSSKRWPMALEPLCSRAEDERDQGTVTDCAATAGKPKTVSPGKPTFLQKERWKAIQKARRKGMSLRAIERDLGIHRGTVRKYRDSEGPPTRRPRAELMTSASDTMAP